MKCEKPIEIGLDLFRCGSCDECRRYRRRVLATRLFLEAGLHGGNFCTLTYRDTGCLLSKLDAQKFLKRFRYYSAPVRIRYVLSGEFGELSGRPHYHAMLFSSDALWFQDLVERSWRHGYIQVGPFTLARAMYVSGYVLKKMHSGELPAGQLERPFVLRSLKPGLGYGAADVLASFYKTRVGQKEFCEVGDVAGGIRLDGRLWPLGDYLRSKVRSLAGLEVARDHFRAQRLCNRTRVAGVAGSELLGKYFVERMNAVRPGARFLRGRGTSASL